jgi:hypothetical protein
MFVAVCVAGSRVNNVVLVIGSRVIEGVDIGFLYSKDVPQGAIMSVEE